MMEVKNLSKILQNSICHISVGMRLYSGGLCFFLVKPEIDFDLLVNWNKFSSGFDIGLLSPITLQVPMMTPLVPYYSCLARATISGIHCKFRAALRCALRCVTVGYGPRLRYFCIRVYIALRRVTAALRAWLRFALRRVTAP